MDGVIRIELYRVPLKGPLRVTTGVQYRGRKALEQGFGLWPTVYYSYNKDLEGIPKP